MKQKPIRDFLIAALNLAEHGWPVFPCNSVDKRPITPHGFKNATKDPEQIMAWWKKFPIAMIGVPMGPASGVFCIDLDRKPGGDDGVATWEKLESENGTVTTRTHETPSTGRHKFFQHQDGIRNIPLDRLAPGLEVKADGGYVIVPPSRMSDGKKYTIINDVEPAPAPPWLLKMINDYYDVEKHIEKDSQTTERASPGPHKSPDIDKIKFVLAEVIPSDDYDKWYHVAGAVRRELGESGWSLFEAWSAKSKEKYDAKHCHKKWEDAKALTRITGKSIYYYGYEADPTWLEKYEQWQQKQGNQKQESQNFSSKLADVLKNAAALQNQIFEPLHWIVPKYLLEGLFLLAGKPKIGKSWVALDVAVAVSSESGKCMEEECEHGDVLALMLEDTDRRIQRRLTKMLGAQKEEWPLKRLTYATSWPRLNEGGLDWIKEWISKVDNPRLIIIDILERVLPRLSNKEKRSQYSTDYDALAMLQELTKAHPGLCIVVLHHQRKADADDLIDTISGTLGLGGAVDAILILGTDKVSRDKYLYGRGRDLEEFNVTIKQDEHARWQVLGQRIEGEAVSPERAKILATLTRVGKAMNIQEVADAIGGKYVNVKNLLTKLYAEGLIEKVATGLYRMPKPQNEMKFDDTDIPY